MESAAADTPFHQSAVTLVADTNYTTAALIIPPIALSLARCLPTLQAPHGSRLRHLVRLLLEARCSWPVMVASVLTGSLVLILAPPTMSGVRVDVTAWGWTYRLAMNLMSSLYAATICGALMHAYLVARHPVQVLEPAVRQPRRLPKFHAPSTASTPATRDAAIIGLGLHDPLAHRWKYLALSMAGFFALVCVPFLMPLLAVLYPGSFIALNVGALSRLNEVPAFILIGTGAYLAFSRPRRTSSSEARWTRYDFYKKLIERYDLLLEYSPRVCAENDLDLAPIEDRMRRTLEEPSNFGQGSAIKPARIAYRLLALAHLASRGCIPRHAKWLSPATLRGYLLALKRLNAEFSLHPEHTEPRNQADGDAIAPVAEHVRLLLDPHQNPQLPAQPDWLHVVVHTAVNAGLLPAGNAVDATPRVRRAERALKFHSLSS